MLVGKKCWVGNMTNPDHEGFTAYRGVIASEPHVCSDDYFYVLVRSEGKLVRVDTDYIYGVEE
jgi:hypothetical protein